MYFFMLIGAINLSFQKKKKYKSHTLLQYFLKIHFNIIFLTTLGYLLEQLAEVLC
jgi:hypothetical protein